MELNELPGKFDMVLASPPCNCFSTLTIPKYWKNGVPDSKALQAIVLVQHTLKLIEESKVKYWVLENPVGMLRKLDFMKKYERVTITQCQYGRPQQKPTDLWGNLPEDFEPRPMCKRKSPCHESAPRGSKAWGVQGQNKHDGSRAKIPYQLSLEMCIALEKSLNKQKTN